MREPGTVFGRYVLEALLGEGGMGTVYRAQDTVLHRRVALKLLRGTRPDPDQQEEASARMLREARASASFEHPNAVGIYDVGEIDHTPYIAMEFVPGRNLREHIGDATLTWELKLRWMLDVASALAAAHEAGMVHRDVKPQNVMVREDGRVKVLDFGIARRMTSALSEEDAARLQQDLPTITTEGMVLGTPQYMPPEQLAGAPLDGRADQFGWAVTTYELISGQKPWPLQPSVVAAITAILQMPPAPLAPLVPGLPAEVDAAIHRALAKLPEERFESMRELIAALDPFAAVPVAQASGPMRPTSNPSMPGFSSSKRLRAAPTDAFAAAAPSDATRPLAPSGAPPATTVERTRRAWPLAAGVLGVIVLVGAGAAASRRWTPSPVAAQPASSAPVAPSPKAVALLDLPLPSSASPAALIAFRRGLQAQHDANDHAASAAYRSALEQDAGLGAAHLRYGILQLFDDVVDARAHFSQALQLRSSLGAHDQILLDAMTPLYNETPSNWPEAERRLEAAVASHPEDAEFDLMLAWIRGSEGRYAEAERAQDAALALDPSYGAALGARVSTRQLVGDPKGAIAAAEDCLRVAPSATYCLQERVWGYNELGQCDAFDRDVHRILAIDPGNEEGYEGVAEVVFALGKPPEVAWEALRSSWKHAPPEDLPLTRAFDKFWMAVVTGDPKAAEADLAEWHPLVADKDDLWSHYSDATARVRYYEEIDALDRAATVADAYLRHKDGWIPDPGLDFWTMTNDGVPAMLEILVRAGKITRDEQARRRAQWVDQWGSRLPPGDRGYLWIYAYADVAQSPAEALEALAAKDAFGPVPPFHPMHMAEAQIGRTYLLAGRVDEALASLERTAKWCRVSEEPFVWVRAALWLAQARQAKGDRDGACAAYGDVVRRWGTWARSATLKEARKGMKALACPG